MSDDEFARALASLAIQSDSARALASVAMGDCNACEFAQASHRELLIRAGALDPACEICYGEPLPRSRIFHGVIIDDRLGLSIVGSGIEGTDTVSRAAPGLAAKIAAATKGAAEASGGADVTTRDQRAALRRDRFVVVDGVLSRAEALAANAACERRILPWRTRLCCAVLPQWRVPTRSCWSLRVLTIAGRSKSWRWMASCSQRMPPK